MNKKFYNRTQLTAAFTMLLDTPDGHPEETVVKIHFDPSDTIFDVSARVKSTIAQNRKPEDANLALKIASFLMSMPLLPNAVVALVRLLDRYGLCPKVLLEASHHTSMHHHILHRHA